MSNEKWNDVWQILRDDRLEFDVKCNNDMLCIICKKVLINAHNSPCGCRYCLDCITNYLNGEDKICPGNTNDCKEELLNINSNIYVDQPMNRKILKTIVICPEESCEFKDEVRNIGDHMRICNSRSIDCPYLNMGCKDSKIVNTGMKNHLLMEIVSHTKMLFELIDNLKNEIQILKDNNVELKKDKEDLKKLIIDVELKYEREIEEKLKEMENKFFEEHKKYVNEIKMVKDATESMKTNALENKFQSIIQFYCKYSNYLLNCGYDNEINERKEKLKETENKLIEEQKKNVNELKTEIQLVIDETESIRRDASQNKRENERKIDEINKTMTDLKAKSNKSDESISNLENEMRVLEKKQEQIGGEFVWRIDKWKEKMEQARAGINTSIYSDAFYSHRNGYKMCLQVCPNGHGVGEGTHLSAFFHLMRGEFDDILSWPFKHDVTFELINQHTTQIHTSRTAKYDSNSNLSERYRKPISDRNKRGFGPSNFISLNELSNNLSLIDNDQIFLRCRVKID